MKADIVVTWVLVAVMIAALIISIKTNDDVGIIFSAVSLIAFLILAIIFTI